MMSFAYSYDVAGNLTTTTQTVGSDAITTTNVYDGINRPIEVSQSGAAVRGLKANYAYSPTGEATSIQRSQSAAINSPATTLVATTDFTRDALDRWTGIAHKFGTTTLAGYGLTYDAASRITQITSTLDGTTNHTLDDAGQLIHNFYELSAGILSPPKYWVKAPIVRRMSAPTETCTPAPTGRRIPAQSNALGRTSQNILAF
jgi:YD repeat-containing protein